jgi:hypothetical protein
MDGQPEGAVRLADIFAEQVRTTAQLAVIAEQLKQLPDHEARIRALERWRYSLPIAVLSAVASAAAAVAAAFGHA